MAGAALLSGILRQLRLPHIKLPALALVAALCSAAYLLSAWQHSDGGVRPPPTTTTTSFLTAAPCNLSYPSSATTTLDFTLHHAGEDNPTTTSTTTVVTTHHFPTCDPKYTEYTPCEDGRRSLKYPRQQLIYRERHCPDKTELLRCLVPAPPGYRSPLRWPSSRDEAWFANIPHTELAVEKGGQNWIKVKGDRFHFPGGGTMFTRGADAYIDDLARVIPLHDGSIRTAIDTGCGVASWGAYLLSRNIVTMSFAPRDTHEAQVQFALERGIPAMIGILASNRLPYPSRAFDMAHCSRCLVPWHLYDGLFLIEIDRILRPGGYWILSGPPINWKMHQKSWGRTAEDLSSEQYNIEAIARCLCWKKLKEKGEIAIWQKPTNHIHCKANRKLFRTPKICWPSNPDAAWYTKMEGCITPLPDVAGIGEIAGGELKKWPERLTVVPPRIGSGTLVGVTPEMFLQDSQLWKRRVGYYKQVASEFGKKGRYRNLLDMNAGFGGFSAALVDDPVWVMNIVPNITRIDSLGVIYERGLLGTYHDWCEAMSTYPRTYDLLHADSVFTLYKDRCDMVDILLEMDRVLRPEGTVIFRDDVDVLVKIKSITDGMRWESSIVDHEDGPFQKEKILTSVKAYWTAPELTKQ